MTFKEKCICCGKELLDMRLKRLQMFCSDKCGRYWKTDIHFISVPWKFPKGSGYNYLSSSKYLGDLLVQ